jgi:hypothetical protein
MKPIILAVALLLLVPAAFAQTVLMPFGDTLVEPNTGTAIIPLQPDGRMGVIMTDKGMDNYTVLTPPVSTFNPKPLPTLPTLEPMPAPTADMAPLPYYDSFGAVPLLGE